MPGLSAAIQLAQEVASLLAADLHLGKESTFRAAGIPLPEGPSVETLEWLKFALERTGARRLPCFQFGKTSAVLSAFSFFTGLTMIKRQPGDACFVIADTMVVALQR